MRTVDTLTRKRCHDTKIWYERSGYLQAKFILTMLNNLFLSDEGTMLETLHYTIRIGNSPTFYISI